MKSAAETRFGKELAVYLKRALKKKEVSYAELADLLGERGFDESEASITNKLSRGTFSASFFIMTLLCTGQTQLRFIQNEDEEHTND
jgi:hypothetical protein